MRVLWVYGYLSRQVRNVARHLVEEFGVTLEVMSTWSELPLDPSLVPMTKLECRNKIDFTAQRLIRDKVKSGGFDIVHCYTSRNLANVLGACRGLKPRPKIVGYRGTVNRLPVLDPGNWLSFWHPDIARIVCVCEATRGALKESGIPAYKLKTVWEGCAPGSLATPPRSERAQFDIPQDAFVVGAVANMRPVKGLDLLLQAALRLHDRDDVYYLLIGDVRDPKIRELAADPRIRDRVRLPGPRPDGGHLAGLMDVYASPSRMEGLSMSIMEAMVQGVCPVVSDVGGNPELVRNEVDGYVVPTEDAAALAAAIGRLYDAPALRQEMAASASQRIFDEFSISKWTERLVQVYEGLVPPQTVFYKQDVRPEQRRAA